MGFVSGGCGDFFRDIGGRIKVRPGSERRDARCVGQAHILQRNSERRSYAYLSSRGALLKVGKLRSDKGYRERLGYFVCLGMI